MEENLDIKTYSIEEVDLIKKEADDKYLRLLAEFDNYKKRTLKEKEDIKTSVKTDVLNSILDLDSDLSLALKNITIDDGIKLIMSKIDKFLQNQNVECIQTENYDSDIHEVISILNVGEQKIIDVVSKGYSINGKIVRYPKIILGVQ